MRIDGTEYVVLVPDLVHEFGHGYNRYRCASPAGFMVVDKCDCCGRFSTKPRYCLTAEEMIAAGWVREKLSSAQRALLQTESEM
jgi:hypothetical protein